MENIKIRISSLVDGTPWLFTGEGRKTQQNNKTIIDATERIEGEEVLHHIEIAPNKIKVSRFFSGATHLEFYPDKKGEILISTNYGNLSGKTITKTFTIKETTIATHILLAYKTSFDSEDAEIKKIHITFSDL